MLDLQNELIAQTAKADLYRMPSYGKFSTNLQTVYSWGVPRQVHFDGMMMDMDMLITLTGNHTNDKIQQKLLQQQLGMMNSTMEHLIPELLFSTEESSAQGVSAVKAIQLAAAEGQRIYHITGSNLETALAAIDLNTSVEREIREAVYAGKEVTTHSHWINFYGAVTAGYIILDPLTGNGVYKIATGEDGAKIDYHGLLVDIAVWLDYEHVKPYFEKSKLVTILAKAAFWLGLFASIYTGYQRLKDECGSAGALISSALLSSIFAFLAYVVSTIILFSGMGAVFMVAAFLCSNLILTSASNWWLFRINEVCSYRVLGIGD